MVPIKNLFFLAAFCLFTTFVQAQYVTVDDTYTAQQLVQNVLINSPCATVSNFSVTGDISSPGAQSFGRFDGGTSSFPFAGGVVLATSRAKRVEGPNDGLVDDRNASWPGDSDLQAALGISGDFFNATVLEFDFLPLSTQFSFDYIFASEEYSGADPCRYSDGFAFLLKKANTTDTYQNLALIPNTNTAVSVITVHDAAFIGCPTYSQYYAGANGPGAPIKLDGQTVPMTASGVVEPNVLYHIKLVIADHENPRYDSAIFLEAGSFKIGTDIGPNRLISSNNPVCAGQTIRLDATEPLGTAYYWYKNNVRIPGPLGRNPYFDVTPLSGNGDYKVEVFLGSSGCVSIGEATIEYGAVPVLANATLVQCDPDNDGLGTFNLKNADAGVKNGNTTLSDVIYYRDRTNATAGTNPITDPGNYPSGATTVFAAAANAYGCVGISQVQLVLSNNTVQDANLETCDLDADPVQDGKYEFLLSTADAAILSGLPSGLLLAVEYYGSEEDALLHPNRKLPATYRNTTAFNQDIYAKVVNGPNCYGIAKVHLIVYTFDPVGFENEALSICTGESLELSVPSGYDQYDWSQDPVNHTEKATVFTAGIYTVTVTENTCAVSKTFNVKIPEPPVITSVDITDVSLERNAVLIHYTGNADYEFSLDGNLYQDNPYFTNVAAGNYTVRARSKCDEDSRKIFVLDYPRFFTPNGDGYNDFWNIESLNLQNNTSIVYIYDQYGKLLKQIVAGGKGWNGTCNGNLMPASDYWFVLKLENGRTVKGHFSLKR